MDFEKAYRKTLAKWQRIAAGEWTNPSKDCGICNWARAHQKTHPRVCRACPAQRHYRRGCVFAATGVGEATDIYLEGSRSELPQAAQLVVEELLSIKDSLFKCAEALDRE